MSERSPVVFWLLVAATIAVDGVAAVWIGTASDPFGSGALVAVLGLIVGQLSVVCIWSALRPAKNVWTNIAPWAATCVACVAAAAPFDSLNGEDFGAFFAFHGLHTAMLLVALWILQRTAFWQRRTGFTATWRYSMAHLLMVMTVVAILAAITSRSRTFFGGGWTTAAGIAGGVSLATLAVLVFSLSIQGIVQFAIVLGWAMLFGMVFALSREPGDRLLPLYMSIYYLIQAIVISSWLGWGQIMPDSSEKIAGAV
jgi:hypothetical protein